jgi:hypothetical protein
MIILTEEYINEEIESITALVVEACDVAEKSDTLVKTVNGEVPLEKFIMTWTGDNGDRQMLAGTVLVNLNKRGEL